MSSETLYTMPVAGLLTIGDPRVIGIEGQVAALGLSQEHVPELVRMAVDSELNGASGDSAEVWAPLHALRVLKGLDASAFVVDLMPLLEFDDDNWVRQELPELFGQIGQAALVPLGTYLDDRSHSLWGHSLVVRALGEIGQQHSELACSFAMDALVEFEAVEALPAIRHAFELDKIDPMVRGPWDSIVDQIGGELDSDDPLIALSQQRDVERRERFFPSHLRRQLNAALGIEPESPFARLMRESGTLAETSTSEVARQQAEDQARKERQRHAEASKEKQKRKASSASRKANRKKRK